MLLIKFKTDKDRINGVYELALNGWVRGLKGGVFEINGNHLPILNNAGIAYQRIDIKEESLDAHQTIRNSPTAGL